MEIQCAFCGENYCRSETIEFPEKIIDRENEHLYEDDEIVILCPYCDKPNPIPKTDDYQHDPQKLEITFEEVWQDGGFPLDIDDI